VGHFPPTKKKRGLGGTFSRSKRFRPILCAIYACGGVGGYRNILAGSGDKINIQVTADAPSEKKGSGRLILRQRFLSRNKEEWRVPNRPKDKEKGRERNGMGEKSELGVVKGGAKNRWNNFRPGFGSKLFLLSWPSPCDSAD
jgi:hypothetical protein